MGEEKNLFFRGADAKKRKGKEVLNGNWAITKDDEDFEETSTSSESMTESSENSAASSASDMADDASSSSSNSLESSSCSSGPLYELSELMVHLPVKRGLSKHYQGKSQSFTSLANAKSLEDLAKRVVALSPTRKKMKSCKSHGEGLEGQKWNPRITAMSRKASRESSYLCSGKKKSCFMDVRGHRSPPPPPPLQNHCR